MQTFSQQTLFYRSGMSRANWWDDENPWYRICDGYSVKRPDDNGCNTYNSTFGRTYVNFDNNSQLTMSVNGTYFNLKSITFKSGASSGRTFNSVSGGGINVDAGINNENVGSITHNFNAPVALGASCSFNSNNGTYIFASNFYLNNFSATFLGNNTISGIISESGGTGSIIKSSNGTLLLSGSNSYTGSTTINAGILQLNNNGGGTLPSNNTIVINNGGTLKVSSNQTLNSITLNSGGTLIVDFGVTLNLSTFSRNGSVTNNGTINVNGTPLPVTFTSLTGSIRNGRANLSWNIADEQNVDRYEVEESVNGRQFQTFTQVDAASRSSYQATDAQLHTGANYYRVKAVDIDGKLTYSKIIRLDNNSAAENDIRVYPNPSRGELNLGLNIRAGNYQIRLINAVGQTVYQQPLTHEGGSRSMQLGLPKLSSGVYQVEVRGGVQKHVRTVRIE
jgi:autotransporter-associated beta strand protein